MVWPLTALYAEPLALGDHFAFGGAVKTPRPACWRGLQLLYL